MECLRSSSSVMHCSMELSVNPELCLCYVCDDVNVLQFLFGPSVTTWGRR